MAISIIQKIKSDKITWVNISKLNNQELKYLTKNFDINQKHIDECLSDANHQKIEKTSKYTFLSLHFPIYHKKTRKITSSEINFFIYSDLIITLHKNELPDLINFFNSCKISTEEKEKYFIETHFLVYQILKRLLKNCEPILDIINNNIQNIEKQIFAGREKGMVNEILIAKTNIINIKKVIRLHKTILLKFIERNNLKPSLEEIKFYFDKLIESTEKNWRDMESMNQIIQAIETTNNSLISFKLNNIIKILTIISVIILPLTLLASLFSMGLDHIPFSGHKFAFFWIIAVMIMIVLIMIYNFKRKKIL
ncbi:magnesium transporter CorA family protein [Patescibacteria group bacterium]|nr:magnesium transporter CorA family protein [Patescibacteria group bacterium]